MWADDILNSTWPNTLLTNNLEDTVAGHSLDNMWPDTPVNMWPETLS
jgi:hypothetical protein